MNIGDINIRPASVHDYREVVRLLSELDLPVVDINHRLDGFLVAFHGEQLIGTIGVEIFEVTGLVRSLTVDPACQKQGLAGKLYDLAEQGAIAQGVRRLYLLATSAESWFAGKGFAPVARENVPAEISKTRQFNTLCPATAAVMIKELSTITT